MPRIALLNSYLHAGTPGRETRRIRAFLRGLGEEGLAEGRDYELALVDSDDRATIAARVAELVAQGIDLIHAVGTPNAMAALAATDSVPIVYYGAHPEGIGEALRTAVHVTGLTLTLPFTASYKNFRFLRRLVPRARVVWSPYFEGTVFIRPEMRALHDAARDASGSRRWLGTGGEAVGFQSLAGLSYIIGVEYREFLYADAAELERALDMVDPSDAVLMPFNESFYCAGAVNTVLRAVLERHIPLIWNNNPHVAALGGLSGIGADFETAGLRSGRVAARILGGTPPRALPRETQQSQLAWLNLDTARNLDLDPDASVLAYFDRHIAGSVADIGV